MNKEDRSYEILQELYNKEPAGALEELPEHEHTLRVFRDMSYNAGYGYLVGLICGSAFGMYEGLLQKEATKSWKLARTSILNHSGRRMASMANAGGSIGTLFCLCEAFFRYFMIQNKSMSVPWVTHPFVFDSRNTAPVAGFAVGAIFKSTTGSFPIIFGSGVAGSILAFLNSRRYTPEKYFDIYKQYLSSDMMG